MHGHGLKTDPHGNLFEAEWRDGKPLLKDKQTDRWRTRCSRRRPPLPPRARRPPLPPRAPLTRGLGGPQQPDGRAERDGWQRERPTPT